MSSKKQRKPKYTGKGKSKHSEMIRKKYGKHPSETLPRSQYAEEGENYKHRSTTGFKNEFYITAYQLAREGKGMKAIAAACGVQLGTIKVWKKKDPAFRKACNAGFPDNNEDVKNTFENYVYRRLPPDLQKYWNKLRKFEKLKNGARKIEAMLEEAGDKVRKWLFVHAMVTSDFTVSEACRRVFISFSKYQSWKHKDPHFCELLAQVHIMKKDFGEGKLMELVAAGDPNMVRFFNMTQNRDRGYDPKVTIEHIGKVEHQIKLDQILNKLPIEDRLKLMNQIDSAVYGQIEENNSDNPRIIQALPAYRDIKTDTNEEET